MVEAVLRGVDGMVPFKAVHASRGKVKRAEPVAALYEQGRVRHRAAFPELERQMAAMTLGRLRRARQPGPGGRAGLGDHRADDRAGGAPPRGRFARARAFV